MSFVKMVALGTNSTAEPLFFAQSGRFFQKAEWQRKVGAMSFFPERKARAKAIKRKCFFDSFFRKRMKYQRQ